MYFIKHTENSKFALSKLILDIHIIDKTFRPFISEEKLMNRISGLADEIRDFYGNECVCFVSVLNGAFMFSSDLLKRMKGDVEISFVKLSSYSGTKSRGQVDELIGLSDDIKNKHIVILEDIVDTGITIEKVMLLLQNKLPKSIQVCTLLYKPEAYTGELPPKFVGFEIENKFVVGYGLDYNELGRNISSIYQLK